MIETLDSTTWPTTGPTTVEGRRLRSREVVVRRQRLQTRIVDRTTDSEVVHDLEPVVLVTTHHLVGHVVEESTDTGRGDPLGLGFQVERLPDQSRLPVQRAVEPRALASE